MAKKWSQKTEKATLAGEDEFLIIDSEDAAPATKNKRVKVKNAAPYKKYVALLTQTGNNAPVATVLENTIGNIVWTRAGSGDYRGTLTGAFPENKTFCLSQSSDQLATASIWFIRLTDDAVQLHTASDNRADSLSIEIRVYPVIAMP